MEYLNKILQCMDCGYDFEFTTSEQEFYASKGLTNHPKRCKPCRIAKKNLRNYGNLDNKDQRTMYDVICTDCGGKGRYLLNPPMINQFFVKVVI